ncbi:MAG: hypothetical protein JWP18_1131 [Solirubrobacterales bacterium]|nr:hypothetical protein [Solirubrobacterales bacterium]
MLPTGIVLLVLGVATAIAAFFWKRSSQKRSGWWSTVRDLDIGAALQQPDGTAVAVRGVSVAPQTDAGAVLKDPVHDNACCWWRETVTEHWEERVRDHSADKDDNRPDFRWEQRSNEVSERVSGVPFLVEDAGRIAVDLQDIDIDGDLLQEETRQSRRGDGDSLAEALVDGLLSTGGGRRDEYLETKLETLAAGKRILVSGRTAGGTIVADAECGLQVCQGTVAEHLGGSRKSEQRAHLALMGGSGFAVLGAVLAAAGAAAS